MSVLVIPEPDNELEQQPEPDERANTPVSVVTERFLRAIVAKVPLDRIEELHLFSPLRQGTVETGIAVIAAHVIVPDEPVEAAPEFALDAVVEATVVEIDEVEIEIVDGDMDEIEAAATADDEVEVVDGDMDEIEAAATPDNEVEVADGDMDEIEAAATPDDDAAEATADEVVATAEDDDSPYADDTATIRADNSAIAASTGNEMEEAVEIVEEAAELVVIAEIPAPAAPRIRHTVYTARYRLVIKGPERGKWEIDVVDEADAPLLAIESVVRGVQRRAGEETATIRYDAAQLARVLRLELPAKL